jgi:peptidoglycan/xylan/chitin deacetylase (PgdA/CDA1 family)
MIRWAKAITTNAAYLARGWRLGTVRGRILTYHRVDEVVGDRLVVTPDAFRAQMEFLKSHEIRVVDLDTLVDSLSTPDRSANQVAITFDDGYADNYRHAWPILREVHYPATVFVAAGLAGTDRPIPAERPGATPATLLTWEQLEEMSKDDISVGSHSLTHARLTRLPLEKVRKEVMESKQLLEARLGVAVNWFCYPSGAFSMDVVRLVQWAGYYGACSIRPGANTMNTHRFVLRRTEISGEDTLPTFEEKLGGAVDAWHSLVQLGARHR